MANYAKTNVGDEGRVEPHEALGITGAEASVNKLPADTGNKRMPTPPSIGAGISNQSLLGYSLSFK